MSLEEWQIELRRQYGRQQAFIYKNLGEDPIFSEYEVTNPQSNRSYRVIIRGDQPFDNYCACADFRTNSLGTCKHIEFMLAQLKKKRGGAAAFKAGFQPQYSEVYLHYGVQREVRFRPGTDCPKELARIVDKYFDDSGVLKPEAFASFDIFLDLALELEPEMRVANDAVSFVAEVRDADNRRKRVLEAFPKGINSADLKDLLSVPLYDYQKEGALFAAQTGRCLIGDEMGLGKTIQSLAATEIMAKLFGIERVLIVCPTSLKHQWQHEISRFVKRTTEIISGSRADRKASFETDSFFKITNYDTIHTDLDMIQKWGPDLVILDEAQRIKNWETRVARHVKLISSPFAIVLTGTPLENRLEELISIIQFVDSHRLGPTFRLLHNHQIRDGHGKVVGYKELDTIGRTLEPVLIRRRKDDVLDQLPERIDSNIFVPMTPQQMEIHSGNMEVTARVVGKWRRSRFLGEADQRRLMIALERMRMSCDSTYLVDHQTDHGNKADEAAILLGELLQDPNTKVVIFSQWLRMHELLVRRLKNKPWGHVLFHGGLSSDKRKEMVDQFRNDPNCRIFLATDAGGVGLNLQFASVVMNMDLPWNPAVLEQRIGRVHRLGQKQAVRVINFVAQGAIEEGILSILKFKQSLFTGILDGGAKEVFLGDKLEQFMEQVEAVTEAVEESKPEEAQPPQKPEPTEVPEPELPEDITEEAPAEQPGPSDPWRIFLEAGLHLLSHLTEMSQAKESTGKTGEGKLVQEDQQTGERYLKLPMPSSEVLQQASQSLGTLMERLKK